MGARATRRSGLAAVGAGLAMLVSHQARPQNAVDPAQAAEPSQDIVVTAARRSERLADVPISVTALGAEELEQRGAKTIEDVARTTPGLVVTPSALGSGSQPTIRGISSAVGSSTVGVYIDDVPVQIRPTPFAGNPDLRLFDIDRVEVLRGPQGTLFGASSEGGTIRYITPDLSFDRWSGRYRAEGAGLSSGGGDYEFGAAGGGPLSDVAAVRASAFFRHDGGYVDRLSRANGSVLDGDVNGADTQAYRLEAELRPTDALRITPSLFYQKTEQGDLPLFEAGADGSTSRLAQRDTVSQPGRDQLVLPSLTASYDLGFASLISVTSYLYREDRQQLDYSTVLPNLLFKTDDIPGFTDGYTALSANTVRQQDVTQEVRLTSSDGGPLRWILGGFYRHAKETFAQDAHDYSIDPVFRALTGVPFAVALGAPLLPGSTIFEAKTVNTENQLAGFGEATYVILPGFEATAGLRVSRSELIYLRNANGALNGGPSFAQGAQRETPVTPKFALSYKPYDEQLLYFSAEKGYRVGGVNDSIPVARCAADIKALGGNPPGTTYASDSLWSYEAGAKGQFADRTVSFGAAVYRIDWDNIQQLLGLPTCGFGYTANLGSARSQGFELEAAYRPVRQLTLGVRTGYDDATFTTDVSSAPSPLTGARAVIARDGDRLPGVPEWTVSPSLDYRFAVSEDVGGFLRGDYQFIGGSRRTLPAGRSGYVASTFLATSYDYGSVRAGVILADGLEASLFVNNLADSRPLIAATTNTSPVTGLIRGTTLRPRQVGLTLSGTF